MRQPRFRKRLEKEHIAEQILTKQIISRLLGRGCAIRPGEEAPRRFYTRVATRRSHTLLCVHGTIHRSLATPSRYRGTATCKLSPPICGITSVLANDLVIANSRGTSRDPRYRQTRQSSFRLRPTPAIWNGTLKENAFLTAFENRVVEADSNRASRLRSHGQKSEAQCEKKGARDLERCLKIEQCLDANGAAGEGRHAIRTPRRAAPRSKGSKRARTRTRGTNNVSVAPPVEWRHRGAGKCSAEATRWSMQLPLIQDSGRPRVVLVGRPGGERCVFPSADSRSTLVHPHLPFPLVRHQGAPCPSGDV